jgi:hypothetical protein
LFDGINVAYMWVLPELSASGFPHGQGNSAVLQSCKSREMLERQTGAVFATVVQFLWNGVAKVAVLV